MSHGRFPVAPEIWHNPTEHRRKLAIAVNGVVRGEMNNIHAITLRANESTTIYRELNRITANSVALLVPLSASAAAASTTLYAVCTKDTVTIHHDSDPATDREFRIVLLG